jgi:hypothetical protein
VPLGLGPGAVLPVAAVPELGSDALAQALAEYSLPGVLRALAYDVAVLPVVARADAAAMVRVFPAKRNGAGPYDLHVFSSAATFERALGNDAERCFIVEHGAAVVSYLVEHVDDISELVIDPAGPASMTIGAATLASFAATPADDDDAVGDDASSQPSDDAGNGNPIIGFDLGLDRQWGTIDIADAAARDRQIHTLVANQTRRLGDSSAALRREMAGWLTQAATKASEQGGAQMAFLLTHTKQAALALSVTTYFHVFGDEVDGVPHIDRIGGWLAERAKPDDEVVRIDVAGSPLMRMSGIGHGAEEVGGAGVPLLLIDYWVPAPDRTHVVLVSFSSPHIDAREAITALADNVVFNGRWVMGSAIA